MTYEEKEIYVHKFEKKQSVALHYYLDVADLAFFELGDLIIYIDDIILDIDKKVKKGVIIEWFKGESDKHDFLNNKQLKKEVTYQEYLKSK